VPKQRELDDFDGGVRAKRRMAVEAAEKWS
jgi:hypothetical protein